MRIFTTITELEEAAGSHLGHSDWHVVTQHMINQFAEVTGDHQWIHVNVDRAMRGPFRAPIAHGYLTLSLTSMLTGEIYRLDRMQMIVNYGADRVRFPTPVPVDAAVRASVELQSVQSTRRGYEVTTRVTVEVDSSQRPACVIDRITLVVPPDS